MASKIGNIVFDCADPRTLSHFWSDVLGYPKSEWPPERVLHPVTIQH